jgi:3-carboxy-cis,cis-muconate cycloisomerase
MAGRTLLQQALPITFGLKAAGWLAGLLDAEAQLVAARSSLAVQLGGAVGTLSALGARGDDVVALFAAELGLPAPPMPWHTGRQRIAGLAGALAVVAGSAGKVALDVTLLAQTEVGEVREAGAPGKGGSSAMPHKRNPVDALAALTAARRTTALVPIVLAALVAEHERGIAGWQAEWSTLTELLALTGGAVAHCCASLTGLEIDADAMRRNLDRAGGVELAERLNLALAPSLGRDEARKRVEQAVAATDEMPFAEALLADPAIAGVLDAAQVAALLDPR